VQVAAQQLDPTYLSAVVLGCYPPAPHRRRRRADGRKRRHPSLRSALPADGRAEAALFEWPWFDVSGTDAVRRFSACTVSNVDILPEGEPLPEEARDMLVRALDGLETPQAPPPNDVIDLIAPDLVATLGWTVDQAREVVATAGTVYEQDPELVTFQVAEEVQQWLHDSFLDTSWPRCPSHRNHPLWLAEDPPFTWHCPRDAIAVAPLGQLDTVVSPPSQEPASAAREQLLREQRTTPAMIEQAAPALRRRLRP